MVHIIGSLAELFLPISTFALDLNPILKAHFGSFLTFINNFKKTSLDSVFRNLDLIWKPRMMILDSFLIPACSTKLLKKEGKFFSNTLGIYRTSISLSGVCPSAIFLIWNKSHKRLPFKPPIRTKTQAIWEDTKMGISGGQPPKKGRNTPSRKRRSTAHTPR